MIAMPPMKGRGFILAVEAFTMPRIINTKRAMLSTEPRRAPTTGMKPRIALATQTTMFAIRRTSAWVAS